MEEKVLLERKLAVALGLLATCKMDLEACRGEKEGQRGLLEMALIISAARLVIYVFKPPPFFSVKRYSKEKNTTLPFRAATSSGQWPWRLAGRPGCSGTRRPFFL